jgi:hypothetical protein
MWIAGMPSDEISHEDTLFSLPQEICVLPLVTVITQFRKDYLAVLFSLAYLAFLDTTHSAFCRVGSAYVNYPLGIIVKELRN